MSTEPSNVHHEEDHESLSKGKIWQVFFVLLGITAIEFIIALYLVPHHVLKQGIANPIYIMLTLAKAFYIVAYFMHLRFEKIGLAYSILVPTIFIIGLILVLTNESNYWLFTRL
ncbi:cytochrome C oxidase subunit IV family protein [Mucilaginibacter arboris]|uniref:Caa(3)-type oxidase n=1 Tax=Mucilaginibacter arboris TaxID=2682090 RepID=A0A7K1SUX5_9SPHI|nr:cytochrome C oxidase subunit IV family protein [Mucilaginibacter arboris]MVN21142.1 caa(3)-type oxidase [Mucilaginibacter arboris]